MDANEIVNEVVNRNVEELKETHGFLDDPEAGCWWVEMPIEDLHAAFLKVVREVEEKVHEQLQVGKEEPMSMREWWAT